MSLRWYTLVIDCHDPHAQAHWWAEALDMQVFLEFEKEVVVLPKHLPTEPLTAENWTSVGPGMVFVPVPEDKTVKNRLHLDLAPHLSDDRDAEIDRLIGLGARRVEVGQPADAEFTVLADPEGNEFCVLSARER
ncbi:MAG TPA: VOC family protein [Candidatus Avipropionibacterium avicola]|uniref:VOC family protein n=1 Tax=Candidatus Avipropionibacterium avicola TaxID=2840701 RepID=A0A9D1GV86_9ACTN|nr:VOC family protein [Candidatus Avipropionibacterium avicola]